VIAASPSKSFAFFHNHGNLARHQVCVPRTQELLFSFFVLFVFATMTAVLADGKTVRVVLFVFHRCVIATFAIAACQRDDYAVVLLSHGLAPHVLVAHVHKLNLLVSNIQ
jgi:hypothetical protein